MKQVYFLFGIHNHQPIGNFDFVFEEAYQKSYFPFLDVLNGFPSLKISIHFTGILLDWLTEKHPEMIEKIKQMVEKGQLEIITGGYYEPILSIIPEDDRIGQIKKLTERIKELFNYNPEGMWLAERVWEPALPSTMRKSDITYTITDDTHFKYAGLRDEQLNGYYITEDLGNSVFVFPISKRLRYTIPFEEPEATIEHLRSMATEDGNNIVVFADDGEKLGVWPNTHNHVYKDKWLERFFQALIDNSEWIKMIHFKQAIQSVKPLGKIYLPTASYAEMMHWALFPGTFQAYEDFEHYLKSKDIYEEVHVFVRGGFWRNFLAKYSEVNQMHKKMLWVSQKLWQLPEKKRNLVKAAFDSLWAAQCNCPYWHGVFGGVYLSHLRDAIYSHLIQAEQLADKIAGTKFPNLQLADIDVDGFQEILVETNTSNVYISPGRGGMIFELDFKPLNKNLLDTMTRRAEGYHKKLKMAAVAGSEDGEVTASIHDLVISKEPDLASKLHYDQYERKAFIDHFLDKQSNLETFAASKAESPAIFYNKSYDLTSKSILKNKINIRLQRAGFIFVSGEQKSIEVIKNFEIDNDTSLIHADYTLKTDSDSPFDIWFGVELNFGLQAGHAHDRYYYLHKSNIKDKYLDSSAELTNADFIGLRDEWRELDIQVSLEKGSAIWRFPIETISLSESGFERVYQSSVVFPNWKIRLEKEWKTSIILKIAKFSA